MDKLLKILSENARITDSQLAAMLSLSVEEVKNKIAEYEANGIIRGYKAVIDWESLDTNNIVALIEIKVTPKRDRGFDEIASTIANFEDVESVYLMSGGFDLAVTVKGKSFKEVALFVAKRLTPLESVLSSSTHFVLQRYKDNDIIFANPPKDERGLASL